MKTLIVHDPHCLDHKPPLHHSETPNRIGEVINALTQLPAGAVLRSSVRPAEPRNLQRVHAASYVQSLLALRGQRVTLDHETFVSPGSIDAALHATGACIDLVEEVLAGRARNGLALVRPPGHHALPDRAMGYCLFNNVAVAAAHALAEGVGRILILDWDVHHGNGTQAMFYHRPDVLFVDLHQDNLFPPGGAIDEAGGGRGIGYTVNVPLPSGSTDADYSYVLAHLLPRLAAWYEPELVLVSCGFDAHAGDPEGGMDLSASGFAAMTAAARGVADHWADGRLVLVLEGGYRPSALRVCVPAVVEVLAGRESPAVATEVCPKVMNIVERVLDSWALHG